LIGFSVGFKVVAILFDVVVFAVEVLAGFFVVVVVAVVVVLF
jgi:hypothetical protein